ncbi:MAG TPA: peptidoglycan-binding protein [Segeticoccus sp.]|uniref:C40 family peptidase n=1 Tax=Segeticoccus sp. TaxID=2706531 RepID=UPI002D7E912F|nr:peptidoglycan-binding protein [Segeticoccus sp.]HET8600654.1 peptidoglycan-binding protein [Segeticoccus sp.]
MKIRSALAVAAGTVSAGFGLVSTGAPAAQATPATPAAAPAAPAAVLPKAAVPNAVPAVPVPATPIVTLPTWTHNVSYGARGALVKRIQRIVGVATDGIFGPRTRSAVVSWQGRHGLVRDGIVGPRTAAKMGIRSGASATRPSTGSAGSALWTHNVGYGARGAIVQAVQRVVGVAADGIFGPRTRSAVVSWQGRHGLVRDGIVGPRTAARMGIRSGASATSPSTGSAGSALWTHNVGYGARGAIVQAVQRIVGVTADGIFGPRTRSAVVSWQGRHGLVRDGIVGPRTAAAMGLRGGSSAGSNASNVSWRTGDQSSRSTTRTGIRQRILQIAQQNLGIRYTWGGDTPGEGFDCSGYVKYVLSKAGINISARTAAGQQGTFSGTSNPQPGDLVFFGSPAYHVGIYAGGGQMYTAHKPGYPSTKSAFWGTPSGYGDVLSNG